jgi:hypothetical protein
VKEKCSLTVSTYDSTIDSLIVEQGAAISYALKPEYIGDGLDANLQATLDLGATEVVCGELMAQICREPGATEGIALGEIQIWPTKRGSMNDPYLLIEAGWTRLRPFLRLDASVPTYATVLSTSDKVNGECE